VHLTVEVAAHEAARVGARRAGVEGEGGIVDVRHALRVKVFANALVLHPERVHDVPQVDLGARPRATDGGNKDGPFHH